MSAEIGEVWDLLQITLDEDGGASARFVRRLFTIAYRALRLTMILALRLRWRRCRFPELGNEPFNLTDAELEREWRCDV
jgi:hypothetical protein